MALLLVQHGKSAAKDSDPTQGLTAEGKAESLRIAEVAKNYGIKPDRIIHSGKSRAAKTASIYHDTLCPSAPLEAVSYLNPLDDTGILAATIPRKQTLMVVGHLPYLERLVGNLITGNEKTKVYQFQNSGIVCLDMEQTKDKRTRWFIKWTLNPTII